MRPLMMEQYWWIISITFHLFTHKIQYNIIIATLRPLMSNFAMFQCCTHHNISRAKLGNDSPRCTHRISYLLQDGPLWILTISTWIINKSTGISYRLVSSSLLEEQFQINPVLFCFYFIFLRSKSHREVFIFLFFFHKLGSDNFPPNHLQFLSLMISYWCH